MTDRNQPQEEDRVQDETDSDDGLWNEFESCATSVTQLYRNCNWRTLQSAAASTTQLYKHGLEQKKRSFDRGFTKGRLSLARELSTMCRYKNKVDVGDIVALLSKYDLLPPATESHVHGHGHPLPHHRQGGGQSPRQRGGGNPSEANPTGGNVAVAGGQLDNGIAGNPNAVFIFQEALAPVANPSASPHRSGLGNFLQTQVYRHRKRQHSPGGGGGAGSPCHGGFEFVSKRFKRL